MIWTHLFPSVRKAERERFKFFFLLSGFLCLGQTLGLVGAESLLLAHLGAGVLPLAFIIASVVTVVLSLLYAFGVDRARNDNYFIRILMTFGLIIASVTILAGQAPEFKTFGLVSLFCLWYANFAISTNHFWTFTADFFDSLQSKRLFPLFTVGASLGGLAGGIIAGLVAGRPGGAEELLWGWVGSFILAAFWLRIYRAELRRWGPLEIEESDETSWDGMRSSVRFLRSSQLGKFLVVSALFMVTSLFVSQYLYSSLFVQAYPEPDDLARFFGLFLAAANALELILELAVTPYLLHRFGIANANLLHPFLTMVAFFGLGFFPGVPAAIFARLNRETLENAVGAPVRNLLFNALPARLRGRMRAFLEGMVVYSGMAFAGLFLFFWEGYQPSSQLAGVLLPVGGFALGLGFFLTNFWLRKDYFEQLVRAIRDGRIELGESGSTLETLPTDRLLGLWENVIASSPQSPLLEKLAHTLGERGMWSPLRDGFSTTNPRVRQIALTALVETTPTLAEPFLKQATSDPDPRVRLYAIRTVSPELPACLEAALQDSSPEVRAEAAVRSTPIREDVLAELLESEEPSARLAALHRLPRGMTEHAETFAHSERPSEVIAALSVLDRWDSPPGLDKLRGHFQDSNPGVRQAVLRSVAHHRREEPQQVLEFLQQALFDSNRGVRQEAVRIFIERGAQAQPILSQAMQTAQATVCHCAISALAGINDEDSRELFASECVSRARKAWLHRVEAAILSTLGPQSMSERFLVMALEDSAERELTTCFRLLEALEQSKVVRSVENVLRFAHARIRSDALEVLSNLGVREATSLLVHLLEEGDLVERAQALTGKVPAPRERPTLIAELAQSNDRWLALAARSASAPGSPELSSEESQLMERLLMLQSVPLFSSMALEQLEAIHSCLTEQHYTKGEIIFNEGDIGDEMFIVADGQVEILLRLNSHDPLLLATVEKGSYFGEMAVLDQDPRSAAARVSEDARLFVLKGEQLKELIYVMPEIAFTIFRVLSERLRRSDRRLDSMARKEGASAD
ncbi:MAG: cyclic nucleotide-binding domain-containing protein [Vulcanimicrobiota bacterium]